MLGRRRGSLIAGGLLSLCLAATVALCLGSSQGAPRHALGAAAGGLAGRLVHATAAAREGRSRTPQPGGGPSPAVEDVPESVLAASVAPPRSGPPWSPEAPVYGVAAALNVPLGMSDGTVLRGDILYPALHGNPAPGPFPVLLTQTPYGKATTGPDPYLVQRGFIEAIVDVRGTGASHGSWGLLDPVQVSDGVTLVRWAAKLPHSNGRVGLYGTSYLAINQLLTAAAIGPHSPLKAIFPLLAASDTYRDLAVMGGLADREFDSVLLGTIGSDNLVDPAREAAAAGLPSTSPQDLSSVEMEHVGGLPASHAAYLAELESGGERAYDGPYWAARRPLDVLHSIVANDIPAYLVGGWHDVFQRGEPINYAGLQNAWAGRPAGLAMLPGQRVTGRYQLYMGPWYHAVIPGGVDLERLQLEWFDTWLRGEPTGMAETSTPLHLQELGAQRVVDTATWPLARAAAQRWYLQAGPTGTAPLSVNDGSLGPARPAVPGDDPVAFAGASSPCTMSTEQWSGGVASWQLNAYLGHSQPCTGDDRGLQTAPTSLTYTSAPFTRPTVLGGPMGATVFAASTSRDCELVVIVDDIGPDGGSTLLTEGALLGSMRAVDPSRTWWTPDGGTLLPYHPLTQASTVAVPPGPILRYDIEVLPTVALLAPGHRLRITLTTSDTPHLLANAAQLSNLVGGVYHVERAPDAASFIELPMAPDGAL
jgi:uncharacterized protein